jgi:hypothetical protein
MDDNPQLAIPLPLVLDDEAEWPALIAAVAATGARQALLFAPGQPTTTWTQVHHRARLGAGGGDELTPGPACFALWAELLELRIAAFARAGIAVGFWMGQTLGHGAGLSGAAQAGPFQHEADATGAVLPDHLCPLCPHLREHLGAALACIAAVRPAAILLDDDFRLSKGNPGWCLCPLHRAAFRRRGLPDLPGPELLERVLSGAPGWERAAWWQVHEDALVDLARALGEAVRAAAPQVRLGLCATPGSWDDLDLPRLLRACAGPLRPLVRTGGAPYWAARPADLGGVVEQVRRQRAWLAASLPEAEDWCEGDTFPHQSSRCAAATLAGYHQALLAAGARRVLCQAFSYAAPLREEPAYAARLVCDRERHALIGALAPAGGRDLGIEVPWLAGQRRRLAAPAGTVQALSEQSAPPPLAWCARCGIPVAHQGGAGPVLLAGRQAEAASAEQVEEWSRRGLVLDAVAALVLARRGLSSALVEGGPVPAPALERFHRHALNGLGAGSAVALYSARKALYHRCIPTAGAEPLGDFLAADGSRLGPSALVREDVAGRRCAVLCWDLCAALDERLLLWSNARRHQLHRLLAWAGGAPLPAAIDAANVHLSLRRRPDGGTVAAVLNGGLDPLAPVLELAPELAGSPVDLLGPTGAQVGRLAPAGPGGRLALPCELPAHGLCLAVLNAE